MAPLPFDPGFSSTDISTVRVDLGLRSYGIHVGENLIPQIGTLLAKHRAGRRFAIITDEMVAPLHLDALANGLSEAGLTVETLIIPAGERSKSLERVSFLSDQILDLRLERGDALIALGGGVIGDLTGFVASMIRRGMGFIQVPTTLLAQVDSSVGGKTGINTRQGKNLLGAFYQPDAVFADTRALDSLPERQFAAGYAEVVKYGLIDDPAFFQWLEENRAAIFAGGPERAMAIAKSCEAKARVVAADEEERDMRALLNLGHTFGHALEAETGFSETLFHGEGVALGMAMAHRFATMTNLASDDDARVMEKHLRAAGLPTRLSDVRDVFFDPACLLSHMKQDKKVEQGKLVLILTRGIGKAFIERSVSEELVFSFLQQECSQ